MLRVLVLAFTALAIASGAQAQTCTTSWENPIDGDWDDSSKWTNGVPIAGSDACIVAPGTYTVSIRPNDTATYNLATLRVGGASGTQTLVAASYLILTDLTVGARGRMEIIPRTVGSFSGLDASGDVLVQGFLSMNYNRIFLTNRGTLEVAPGGTLRGTNDARLGGSNGTFTIRGTVELADGGSIYARAEVLGGTVRVTSGRGDLFNEGGILQNATLHTAAGSSLIVTGNYEVQGSLSGSPQGETVIVGSTLTAAASGVTFNVSGAGLQFGNGSTVLTALTGGPIRNTARLVLNFGSAIQGTTLTNEGALVNTSSVSMSDGAVIRNRPSGVLTMVDSQFFNSPNTGVVRVVNEGLLVREDVGPGETSARFFGVTLESLPGSEIRVLDDYLDLASGPNTEALPPGVLLSGVGVVRFGPTPVRSTFSPGTEANPIGALGPRTFDTFTLGPEAITIVDVDAGGVSDRIVDQIGRGATMTLGGTLRVRVRPGFTPAIGDSWVIGINALLITSGAFDTIEAIGAPAGVSFVVDLSQNAAIILRAVALVSAGNYGQFVPEDQTGTFVLIQPSSPEPFTINVEVGGTATPFLDYSMSATRGIIRTRPNSTGTLVPVFMRTDPDGSEGEETVTLRIVPGLDAAPGTQPESLLRIQDGPPSTQLSVNGINPAFGANFGLVTAIVYGTAFSDDLDIRLTGPATIVGTAIAAFPQAGGVRVTFDLRDQPPGLYDVVLTGNGVATLVAGFGVIAPGVEFPIWSAVNGTPAPRLGRWSTYTVTIGNDGFVDIFDTYITIRINGAGEIIIEQTSVLNGAEDDPEGVEIEGQDVVPIYIYKLPAGGNIQFTVRARGAVSGEPLGVTTQLHRPNPKASFTTSGDFADLETDSGTGLSTYWGMMSRYMNHFLTGGAPLADTGTRSAGDLVCLPAPADLDDVQLTADATAEEAGRDLGARAFTPGSDILIQPDGAAGASAHEMIHTLIQMGREINPAASPLEVEAAAHRTIRNMIHDNTNRRSQSNLGFASVASTTTLPESQVGILTSCTGGIVGASGRPQRQARSLRRRQPALRPLEPRRHALHHPLRKHGDGLLPRAGSHRRGHA